MAKGNLLKMIPKHLWKDFERFMDGERATPEVEAILLNDRELRQAIQAEWREDELGKDTLKGVE